MRVQAAAAAFTPCKRREPGIGSVAAVVVVKPRHYGRLDPRGSGMNLMEATIFAILVAGQPVQPGAQFGCLLADDGKMAVCSDDTVIREFADGTLEFGGRHKVSKDRRRQLVFSTGITAHFDSFGW